MDVTTNIKFIPNVVAVADDYEEGLGDILVINKEIGECFL